MLAGDAERGQLECRRHRVVLGELGNQCSRRTRIHGQLTIEGIRRHTDEFRPSRSGVDGMNVSASQALERS
jgi:hypothetical protein